MEMLSPYNPALLRRSSKGGWETATAQRLAGLSREVDRQAAMIGDLNASGMYMAVSGIAILFVLLVRGTRR